MNKHTKEVGVGLIGFGTVGAGVYKNLIANQDLLIGRTGSSIKVKKIAVSDPTKKREIPLPPELLASDWKEVIQDPSIDIVVELIGGTTIAKEVVEESLKQKKIVITGNKALLAEHGRDLIDLAEKENIPLYFEAAVAGGIPIIKVVGEALVGNHIESIYGIINGTSNYILTRMTEEGISYAEALQAAQDLGYAESDPTLDINGWDAAHKALVLAWLSYGNWLRPEEIYVLGIDNIDLTDVGFARELGYHIKLLSVIKPNEDGSVELRTEPTLLPKTHILAHVNGVNNALAVNGDIVGETLYYGSGAGQDATSSSVISDLADAATNLANNMGYEGFLPRGDYGKVTAIKDTTSQYYLRLSAQDEPGVVASVSSILSEFNIGIMSVLQPQTATGKNASIILMLHEATWETVETALQKIQELPSIIDTPILHRVQDL